VLEAMSLVARACDDLHTGTDPAPVVCSITADLFGRPVNEQAPLSVMIGPGEGFRAEQHVPGLAKGITDAIELWRDAEWLANLKQA
jgi:hypothetical protein